MSLTPQEASEKILGWCDGAERREGRYPIGEPLAGFDQDHKLAFEEYKKSYWKGGTLGDFVEFVRGYAHNLAQSSPPSSIIQEIKVLDHGYVRLVDWMGSDLSIVRSARVSYNADWRTGEDEGKDEKLIHYMMKHRHNTPFESVTFTFEVKAPIFVFRQWHRHRTQCLAGTTPVIFETPNRGVPYPMAIQDIVRKWNPPLAKRQRSKRSLQDFNRQRLQDMDIRGSEESVRLVDAWYSGEKELYRVKTKYGEVSCSADHLFKGPEGPIRIIDSPQYVMGMVQVGNRTKVSTIITPSGIERWKEIADGYEVSTHGRVRSYWGRGARTKKKVPVIKQLTFHKETSRLVVGMNGVRQVSKLVATAFLGYTGVGNVLHKDDNTQNNCIDNLYIGTSYDNMQDQYINGGRRFLREAPIKIESIQSIGFGETFDIEVTGKHWFAADNILVHNSYNELSARYSELPEEYFVPTPESIGRQSITNKQGRQVGDLTPDELAHVNDRCLEIDIACQSAFTLYHTLLAEGWPRELARVILPVATYSKMFATLNLLNLFKFLSLRIHPHAQEEIRVYADAMLALIEPIVPIAVAAWKSTQQKYMQP